jgi:predicted  nucleic acid-binding Zn-ribbon protein
MKTYERVPFRMLRMTCCGHLLCWVNPRRPNHCPECGAYTQQFVPEQLVADDDAVLELDSGLRPTVGA